MRSFVLTLLFAMTGLPAAAHIGHLGELAGHDHWIAAGALGAAAALAGLRALKDRKQKAKGEENAEPASEAEPQEA